MAGLYRIERAGKSSDRSLHFLRLLKDGRARTERVVLETLGSGIKTHVEIGPFSKSGWSLRELEPKASPQLCLAVQDIKSCYRFHMEFPGKNLILFDDDATLGNPTIVLRRQT